MGKRALLSPYKPPTIHAYSTAVRSALDVLRLAACADMPVDAGALFAAAQGTPPYPAPPR
jgi:hypothetical protein